MPTEERVDAFAHAYVDLIALDKEYGPRLQNAQSPGEEQQLRAEAEQQMQRVLADEGLTPAEFERMGQQIETDPQLRERVEQKIQELAMRGQPTQ